MLQLSPDSELDAELEEKEDDSIFCARCETLITRTRWALSLNGHEHVFFNPAGMVYRILCFVEAPGAVDQGNPTDEFTWFRGYDWNFALCSGCGEHLGWRYTGDEDPNLFFGLIKDRLTTRASDTPGD